MRKRVMFFLTAALLSAAIPSLWALDLGNGLSVGGGVKTGLEIKNSDFAGNLEGVGHTQEYPMTLYFASKDNEAYNGEGWFEFAYSSKRDWGLKLTGWAHGSLKRYDDSLHLGDHYLWVNLFDDQFRFIGGQGGGSPISTGGWLNADWLSYNGIRLFYVSPFGFSIGINLVDPGNEGIKPVEYLTTVMLGVKYEHQGFWMSAMLDNNPVYDDSDANYDGGLHRLPGQPPIGLAGNVAFGAGVNSFADGRLNLAFDGIITNIGEDDVPGFGDYKISPVETTLALKSGFSFTKEIYAELKAKYTMKDGDNGDNTATTSWGCFAVEPYASFAVHEGVKLQASVNFAWYINSYYLAVPVSPTANGTLLEAGQVPSYPWAFDYYSSYQLTIDPSLVFSIFGGGSVITGYKGTFSRDHVENSIYVDFRWAF